MNKLEKVLEEIAKLEEQYEVQIAAIGGSYGSSKLVVIDEKTNESLDRG